MHRLALIPTLSRAYRQWASTRETRNEFLRWLRNGRLDLRAEQISMNDGLLASLVKGAVLQGADEVIFAERRLRGLRSLESDPRFWALDWGDLVGEWVNTQPHPFAPGDDQHFARHMWFERIDEYLVLPGSEPVLAGGYSKDLEDHLEIMRMALLRPWTLEITRDPGEPTAVRGKQAIIQANDFRPATLMSFRIEYNG